MNEIHKIAMTIYLFLDHFYVIAIESSPVVYSVRPIIRKFHEVLMAFTSYSDIFTPDTTVYYGIL